MSLKLFSLNIECDKHFDRWLAVAQAEAPDVICLQEIFEVDMPFVEKELGMKGSFFPMLDVRQANKYNIPVKGRWGIGFFTKLAFVPGKEVVAQYYAKSAAVPVFTSPNDAARLLAIATVIKDGQEYTIGTTHFTWSGGGQATDEQRRDLRRFLELLAQFPETIFCGDFNAPRGGEIFAELEKRYVDHLPKEVKTTIDPVLHYAAPLYLVVDTIFSTHHYQLANVRTLSGISDHMGVVAEVVRTE